ncbi:MAG: succinyl-diaminopimelate desuccinylase [Pseudomonadota bacterium]
MSASTLSPTVQLASDLIAQASVTPNDADCQRIMCERLSVLGFSITELNFGEGAERVKNFWATHGDASEGPILAFAGHTDVVPTGPLDQWSTDPFEPTIKDGMLYGRGAADMKGSLASMVVACEEFLTEHPDHTGQIAFLITSDEEGPATDGTVKVVEWLRDNQIDLTWCIVGEPSSKTVFGDMIKNGRRGSLNANLTINGQQGHIAYPHLANNPIHLALPALTELSQMEWDQGNEFFQPTSLQFSNVNSGTGATNVIPGTLNTLLNFRFSTEVTADELKTSVEAILKQHQLDYEIIWNLSGEPFLTGHGDLLNAVRGSIKTVTGRDTEISTSGGTSDGRFIAQLGTQIVECGPLNATIHQINECVSTDDLDSLTDVYKLTLGALLS